MKPDGSDHGKHARCTPPPPPARISPTDRPPAARCPVTPTNHAEFPIRLHSQADPSTFPAPIPHPRNRNLSSSRGPRRRTHLGASRHNRAPPPPPKGPGDLRTAASSADGVGEERVGGSTPPRARCGGGRRGRGGRGRQGGLLRGFFCRPRGLALILSARVRSVPVHGEVPCAARFAPRPLYDPGIAEPASLPAVSRPPRTNPRVQRSIVLIVGLVWKSKTRLVFNAPSY
jgi:hypothetical protein